MLGSENASVGLGSRSIEIGGFSRSYDPAGIQAGIAPDLSLRRTFPKKDFWRVDMLRSGVIVNYNTTSSSTSLEDVMSTRLVPVLLLTAMLYALGAGIASLPRHPAAPAKLAMDAAPSELTEIPVLPTIVVRPSDDALAALLPAATQLPTVTVHPSADEFAAARALDSRAIGTGGAVVALHALGGGMSSRSGLDMPYYSFGKTVYRLRKE
jgi:hypothetical protein